MKTEKELNETQSTVADKIRAAVQKELMARDGLASGLANLRAKRTELDEQIITNAVKRSKMVLERVEHIKAGGSDEGLDALIRKSQETETINRNELKAIEKSLPGEQAKLKQATVALERAGLEAVKRYRGDAEAERLAVAFMDFIEGRQKLYEDFLKKDLDLSIDGRLDWRKELDPHLSNSTIKRIADFGPYLEQPPNVLADAPTNERIVQPAMPEPRTYTDAETQADCREHGRSHTTQKKQQETAGDGGNVLS